MWRYLPRSWTELHEVPYGAHPSHPTANPGRPLKRVAFPVAVDGKICPPLLAAHWRVYAAEHDRFPFGPGHVHGFPDVGGQRHRPQQRAAGHCRRSLCGGWRGADFHLRHPQQAVLKNQPAHLQRRAAGYLPPNHRNGLGVPFRVFPGRLAVPLKRGRHGGDQQCPHVYPQPLFHAGQLWGRSHRHAAK